MEWQNQAACTGLPCEWFFEEGTGLVACRICPVRRRCLEYAREHKLDGVWGGRRLKAGQPAHEKNFKREAFNPEHLFESHKIIIRINQNE